jgi:hypothetical protein
MKIYFPDSLTCALVSQILRRSLRFFIRFRVSQQFNARSGSVINCADFNRNFECGKCLDIKLRPLILFSRCYISYLGRNNSVGTRQQFCNIFVGSFCTNAAKAKENFNILVCNLKPFLFLLPRRLNCIWQKTIAFISNSVNFCFKS